MVKWGWLWGVLALVAMGCGSGEYAEVEEPTQEIPEMVIDTLPADIFAAFDTLVGRRMAAGDTVAIDPERLRNLVPDSLSGYIREVDRAERFVTRTFTFSEGTKVFFEEDGNDYIEFIAGDYVANPDFFEVVLQRYQLANGYEIDGVTDQKLELEGPDRAEAFIGWETYNQNRQLAQIHFTYDYRFFVSVSATGQETFLNPDQVMGWVNWAELP